MPFKIAVLKNYLPTRASPFVVRSENSDIFEFDKLVENMAKGRTTLSQTDIVRPCSCTRRSL